MAKNNSAPKETINTPLAHGDPELPALTVDDYNNELRDKTGFVGDRANKRTFQLKLGEWRKLATQFGEDPLGKMPTGELSKKKIDSILQGDDIAAAAIVASATEDFAQDFAKVISKFLKLKSWSGTERIAVGGGFRDSRTGELAIARTALLLRASGAKVDLVPIAHHPDDAGLIGSLYLMPTWMLKGHKAILAVDIGGTNMRAGIIEFDTQKGEVSEAKVGKFTLWRHADDRPSRSAAMERLVDMLQDLIGKAEKAKLKPAPVIGIACPGIINPDGSIERGGQNLPGGNWDSDHFNLPAALMKAIPQIGGHDTFVMMHNDAVVQGLSQIPHMGDVSRWGIMTIGTGLGNARFTNRESDA